MKILHLKYKMHKLVNLVFYLIIFGIGFLLGFGAEKINFNKLISQFLFIDNVSAYSINDEMDEELIFNLLSRDETFNIDEYPYIYVLYGNYNSKYNTTISSQYRVHAFSKDFFQETEILENTHTYKSIEGNITYFYFYYNNSSDLGDTYTKENADFTFLIKPTTNNWFDDSMLYFTNFNFKELSNEENSNHNKLDFSRFMSSTCDNCNNGGDNIGNNDNENNDDDNTDEDIEVEIVNSGFYEFAQKIFGEVSEENKFIYDFITFGLIVTCFTLFVLIVGYIFNKFFGG